MGVVRGHRGQTHLIRQGLTRMRAYSEDVGKGLYIGGDDIPPYQHHHDTSSLTTTTSATTTPPQTWRSRMSDQKGNYFKTSNNQDYGWRQTNADDELSPHGQHLQRSSVLHPPASSSSPSSLPLSSVHSQQGTPSSATPYTKSSFSRSLHPPEGMNSAHSSYHQQASRRSTPSPLSSSSSSSQANANPLNLRDEHVSVNLFKSYHQGPAFDPLPTTWDISWNQTDNLCFNKTSGNYDCWDLFNPNENDTATQNATTFLEDEYRMWTLVLLVIPLLTVFGNVLVVLSVIKEKSLKTVTNYFICSLALADIMVAVIVMPFAVYTEVMKYRWMLDDGLCDAWIASDVLGCTASILNLTAICVDRFIAVTQPIKYAKHKNSKRVFVMLAITWVISVAIAAPIALGVNYSEARKVGDCQFFNSDFIIYSSMGSFYIPSMIMCFLYWKIYRVIRLRALKAKRAKQMREVDKRALQGVIENPATTAVKNANDTGGVYGAEATVTTVLANMDNGRITTYNTTKATTSRLGSSGREEDANQNSNSDDNSNDEDDEDTPSGSGSANNNTSAKDHRKLGVASVVMQISPRFLRSVEVAELITNPVAQELDRQESLRNQDIRAVPEHGKNGGCFGAQEASASTSGGTGQTYANEAETPFTSVLYKGAAIDSPGGKGGKCDKNKGNNLLKKGVTKFNFHVRVSRKRKEKSCSRREKKATKTLAIVLGVFLACWVPFFTLNIIKAICIRYDLNDLPACQVDPIFFSLFQWLGYINSFLNPVIYTIFNQEFRKAFRKLLTDPCR